MAKSKKIKKQKLVEVVRSFSYKKNLGNFENVDFFCSQKKETPENQAEKTSEELYLFCKQEVIKSANSFKAANLAALTISAELLTELKKWLKQEIKSNYGKQSPQEKYNEESKAEDIKAEMAETEEIK